MMPKPHRPRGSGSGHGVLPTVVLHGMLHASPDEPRRFGQPLSHANDEHMGIEAQPPVVLVAEDEETIAETLAMIVEEAGYVALVAHDGREALALARQHNPQLIITDLMMPFLTGADLIAAVHSDAVSQGSAPPPVLVVTAVSSARADELGADAIIAKPFDITRIEEAMQQLLADPGHQQTYH